MKFYLPLIAVVLLIPNITYAQDPIPAKISGYSSFVATNDIVVHPFMGNTNTVNSTKDVDYSIHFTLKRNTKFYIIRQVDSNSAVLGYVVKVWNYKNNKKSKGNTANRSTNGGKDGKRSEGNTPPDPEELNNLRKSIAHQDSILKLAKASLAKDSLALLSIQNKLTGAQTALQNSSKKFLSSGLTIDAKGVFPLVKSEKGKLVVSKEVIGFMDAQSELKEKLLSGETVADSLRARLLDAGGKLPPLQGSAFEQNRSEYLKAKNNLDKIQASLKMQTTEVQKKKEALNPLFEVLKNALTGLRKAESQNDSDNVDDYTKTKEQRGEVMKAPNDPTSPYATFDELAYVSSWANGWKFFIPANVFSLYCVSIYPSSDKFTWGFLTMPLKLRFDNKNKETGLPAGHFGFEQNLNFGVSFGGKHQFVSTNDISLNYLLGVSVVNVPLNNATDGNPATSAQAVSLSAGLMFQYDKFQIGAFLGKDFTSEHAKDFLYQGKTWLGIAVGVSLFGEGKTTADTEKQNQ